MKYKIIINKDIKEKGGSPPFSTINSSENYNHSLMCSFVEYIIVFLLSTQNLHRKKRCSMRIFLLSCSSAFKESLIKQSCRLA